MSDTSVLTALLTIGQVGLLPSLFAEVWIPTAVQKELLKHHAALPDCLLVSTARNRERVAALSTELDPAEAEAIVLAHEMRADYLLIDEHDGREAAKREGLRIIGVLGVVGLAKRRALIPLARPVIEALRQQAGIYVTEALVESVLHDLGEA